MNYPVQPNIFFAFRISYSDEGISNTGSNNALVKLPLPRLVIQANLITNKYSFGITYIEINNRFITVPFPDVTN